MAKILRLHDTGSSTHEGWGPTGKIGPHEVERLLDPQGGRAAKVAVSIPSPFARMHLVETALRFVTQGGVSQDSVYHQLVSHFWDVWEMVFNFHQRKLASQRLQIRAWRKDEELAKLRANPATRPLADVLSLYLDGRFAKLTEMHLIYFPGANGVPQLIGGTSPLTLFFPAPNVKPLPVQRPQGGGYYFDNQYVPLANREAAFRDYVYQEFVGDPALTALAPLVRDTLDRGLLQKWAMDGTASLSNFPILTDAANNQIDVAGVLLRVRPDEGTVRGSDLFIRPTRAGVAGPMPIVLRPGLKAVGKKYYNETLFADSGATVPAADARPLKERTLPGPELPYPYLTVNDLLEETLLAVPYEVDEDRFFCGNLKIAPGFRPSNWPLLPIKPLYFDYFTQAGFGRAPHAGAGVGLHPGEAAGAGERRRLRGLRARLLPQPPGRGRGPAARDQRGAVGVPVREGGRRAAVQRLLQSDAGGCQQHRPQHGDQESRPEILGQRPPAQRNRHRPERHPLRAHPQNQPGRRQHLLRGARHPFRLPRSAEPGPGRGPRAHHSALARAAPGHQGVPLCHRLRHHEHPRGHAGQPRPGAQAVQLRRE